MNIRYLLDRKGDELHRIGPDAKLNEAVSQMARHRVGSLAVMEGQRLLSIVTERDVLCAVDTHGEGAGHLCVREIMAPRLVTCLPDLGLDEAMELMFHNVTGRRIRHLPVVENEHVLGVISIGDVVHALLTETRFENKLLKHYIRCWPEEQEEQTTP